MSLFSRNMGWDFFSNCFRPPLENNGALSVDVGDRNSPTRASQSQPEPSHLLFAERCKNYPFASMIASSDRLSWARERPSGSNFNTPHFSVTIVLSSLLPPLLEVLTNLAPQFLPIFVSFLPSSSPFMCSLYLVLM